MSINIFYVTTKDAAEARSIAHTLLEERLIACGNIIPSICSIYRWQGKTMEDNESLLLLKTDALLAEKLTKRIKELHSYECPCIVNLPVTGGHPPFLEWVRDSCIP